MNNILLILIEFVLIAVNIIGYKTYKLQKTDYLKSKNYSHMKWDTKSKKSMVINTKYRLVFITIGNISITIWIMSEIFFK